MSIKKWGQNGENDGKRTLDHQFPHFLMAIWKYDTQFSDHPKAFLEVVTWQQAKHPRKR